MVLRYAYLAFVAIYVFFTPGYLFSRRVYGRMDNVEALAMGLGMSLVIVPVFSFTIALLLETVVNEGIVLATATTISLFCGITREHLVQFGVASPDVIEIEVIEDDEDEADEKDDGEEDENSDEENEDDEKEE
ncbi:MAG: hypothetical protein QF415_15940 [Candidatus Undinarchaeales archaeon]|jgi:uncharacterized membrane protein|nr:hypothetical protein [Candidatus Undinarchaeales archaeon]MDP7492931.1 hypothetical protein [Candidatus Undinarchaeales archaeon]